MYSKWIPVNERLPEEWDMYLVAWVPNRGKTEPYIHYYGLFEFDSYFNEFNIPNELKEIYPLGIKILAWQPLPEPYKEV